MLSRWHASTEIQEFCLHYKGEYAQYYYIILLHGLHVLYASCYLRSTFASLFLLRVHVWQPLIPEVHKLLLKHLLCINLVLFH